MNTEKQVIVLDNKTSITPYINDIINIYKLNKWGDGYDQSVITEMYASVIYRLALNDGKVVGALRAFSDNVVETHILDIAIHPDYIKEGIGSLLMDTIFKEYKNTIIYTKSLNESCDFFSKIGMRDRSSQLKVYVKKPNEEHNLKLA